MQELHPCTGCEYYNKPYWSVVSPCSNCPKIFAIPCINGTIDVPVSNNLRITGTVSINDTISTTYLPTAKEYSEMAEKSAFQFTARWSEPKYQCPRCGGGMRRNEMVVLTTYPAKYEYQCDKCGHVDYQYR